MLIFCVICGQIASETFSLDLDAPRINCVHFNLPGGPGCLPQNVPSPYPETTDAVQFRSKLVFKNQSNIYLLIFIFFSSQGFYVFFSFFFPPFINHDKIFQM